MDLNAILNFNRIFTIAGRINSASHSIDNDYDAEGITGCLGGCLHSNECTSTCYTSLFTNRGRK